jgi:hypothetical protein
MNPNKIYFRHIHNKQSPRGGITLAAIQVSPAVCLVAASFCHKNDNYNKATGRVKAAGRLKSKGQWEAVWAANPKEAFDFLQSNYYD